jgi:glutamyl-tRNA synthetase
MYADEGFLPEALRNALIRLGWSHGDQELFTDQELCTLFDLDGCGKSPAVFDVQKLAWVNGEFIKRKNAEEFTALLKEATGTDISSMLKDPGARKLVETVQHSVSKVNEALPKMLWYLNEPVVDPDCQEKILAVTQKEWIQAVVHEIESKPWKPEIVFETFKGVATQFNVKVPQVAKAVRVLLTGNLHSPDMGVVCGALGKEKVLTRLKSF